MGCRAFDAHVACNWTVVLRRRNQWRSLSVRLAGGITNSLRLCLSLYKVVLRMYLDLSKLRGTFFGNLNCTGYGDNQHSRTPRTLIREIIIGDGTAGTMHPHKPTENVVQVPRFCEKCS